MLTRLKHSTFNLVGRWAVCKLQDTIVLAGSPRSGTTWLLELFRTLPGYKALNEPMMYEEARQNGFSWRTYIEPGEHRPRERAYLQEILTGRPGIFPAWHFETDGRLERLLTHANRRKLVVKFCRAGRMLQWMCRQFDIRGPLLIIRHPCAVAASMLRHGGWDEIDPQGWRQRATKSGLLPDRIRDEHASTNTLLHWSVLTRGQKC